eukprot:6172986-Pleurochrysis_carterae.AAC.1
MQIASTGTTAITYMTKSIMIGREGGRRQTAMLYSVVAVSQKETASQQPSPHTHSTRVFANTPPAPSRYY